jgi:hypothetical protein
MNIYGTIIFNEHCNDNKNVYKNIKKNRGSTYVLLKLLKKQNQRSTRYLTL